MNLNDKQLRLRIAQDAARLMFEHGIADHWVAKRKAAARLGVSDSRHLPRNTEIEAALAEYQRIFHAHSQPRHLQRLRETGLNAMTLLAEFSPRLVGSVLSGTAGEHSDVNLHLFADTPEEVGLYLMARQIPTELRERRLRMKGGLSLTCPVYRFQAGDISIDLTVLPRKALRQAPLSPVNGRPMERASVDAVRELLHDAEGGSGD